MPHATFTGGMDLEELQSKLQPIEEKDGQGGVLQTLNSFLRQDKRMLLVEAKCIEFGPAQMFFIALDQDPKKLQVRIFNHPRPPRTPGVQRIVGLLAKQVHELGAEFLHSNMPEFSDTQSDGSP